MADTEYNATLGVPQDLDDKSALDEVDNSAALTLVLTTFEKYRNYRWRNHDVRWTTADSLYYGFQPKQYWEGTRVERSSLPVHMVFEHIESALPIVLNALFGDNDWFDVVPMQGASIDEARQKKERLFYLLETPRDSVGTNTRTELALAIKQNFLYGNGFLDVEPDAASGEASVHWRDTRDVYVDPGATTPLIDDCKSAILRRLLTVDQLESLRSEEGIKLPPVELLRQMASQRPTDTSDSTKRAQEAYRNVTYSPGIDDQSDFTYEKMIEVLEYVSETRRIWVLNRMWVALNDINDYGFINLVSCPCFDVPGRLYGMGFADVLEGDQKAKQAIFNRRLDEVNLSLNPPRVVKRGGLLTPSSLSIRPGLVNQVENPREDMITVPPQNILQTGWQEIGALEQSSRATTGINQAISQGQPLRSNASRTTAGINIQSAGPTSRMQRIVQLIEEYMIVPMLYKLDALDKLLNPQQAAPPAPPQAPPQPGQPPTPQAAPQSPQPPLPGLTPAGQPSQVPVSSIHAPVKFRMVASSRMLNQSRLMQIVPFLSQYLLNGPFVQQLSKAGQTVDFMEFFRMLQDATGTRDSYKLVRPLTQQEQQAMQKPSPEAMMKMQQAQQANQTRLQVASMQDQQHGKEMDFKQQELVETIAVKVLEMIQGMGTASPEGPLGAAELGGGGGRFGT